MIFTVFLQSHWEDSEGHGESTIMPSTNTQQTSNLSLPKATQQVRTQDSTFL